MLLPAGDTVDTSLGGLTVKLVKRAWCLARIYFAPGTYS